MFGNSVPVDVASCKSLQREKISYTLHESNVYRKARGVLQSSLMTNLMDEFLDGGRRVSLHNHTLSVHHRHRYQDGFAILWRLIDKLSKELGNVVSINMRYYKYETCMQRKKQYSGLLNWYSTKTDETTKVCVKIYMYCIKKLFFFCKLKYILLNSVDKLVWYFYWRNDKMSC